MRPGIINKKLYEKLKREIQSGHYPAGYHFPPEVDFAQNLGVSRNTLRRAFQFLETDHLIVRKWGAGTFVANSESVGGGRRFMLIHHPTDQEVNTGHIEPLISAGIETALSGLNIELDHCFYEYLEQLSLEEIVETIRNRRISGVMWHCTDIQGHEKIYLALKQLNLPVVLLYCFARDYQATNWAAIPQNTQNAWCEGLRYLRSLGHHRIVTINYGSENFIRQEFTPGEYQQVLRSLQLDPDPQLVIKPELNASSLEKHFRRLMGAQSPPTALLCYSDYWAPLIFHVLKKMQLRVPEDIAVMGYCGTPNSAYMNPPLSTVAIDYRAIGSKAVEILATSDQWFCSESSELSLPPFVPVPYRVIERRSTKAGQVCDRIVNLLDRDEPIGAVLEK